MYAPEMIEATDDPPAVGYAALQGMHVDPDGLITYDFDGHIHADGLDLDALPELGPDGAPQLASAVRWLRLADGAAIAELATTINSNGQPYLRGRAFADGADASANIEIETRNGDRSAGLHIEEQDPTFSFGVSRHVTAHAMPAIGAIAREARLIDDLGQSSFAQAAGDLRSLRYWGPYTVNVPVIAAGGFATVSVAPAGLDITGAALALAFGNSIATAGTQRIVLSSSRFPTVNSADLLFLNPTGAASVLIPYRYMIVAA